MHTRLAPGPLRHRPERASSTKTPRRLASSFDPEATRPSEHRDRRFVRAVTDKSTSLATKGACRHTADVRQAHDRSGTRWRTAR